MKALTAIFIVERILIMAFLALLGAKFAVYCDLLDKDFSWYYVLMPILGIILLVPISMTVVNRSVKNLTR
jgi:hypothetical protein